MRPSRHPKLRAAAIWLASFVVLMVGFIFLFKHEITPGNLMPQSRDFQVITQPDGTVAAQIKTSALPQSDTARANAPQNYLLPSHWVSDPQTSYLSDDGLVREVDPVDPLIEKQLLTTTASFLAAWETFYPMSDTSYARYRATLAPFAVPGALDRLAQRVDSHQPPVICAEPICTVGSRWASLPAASALLTIRSYDGAHAYLTSFGAVSYRAPGQELNGQKFVREYALLLDRVDGRWLVSRAAADTVSAG